MAWKPLLRAGPRPPAKCQLPGNSTCSGVRITAQPGASEQRIIHTCPPLAGWSVDKPLQGLLKLGSGWHTILAKIWVKVGTWKELQHRCAHRCSGNVVARSAWVDSKRYKRRKFMSCVNWLTLVQSVQNNVWTERSGNKMAQMKNDWKLQTERNQSKCKKHVWKSGD